MKLAARMGRMAESATAAMFRRVAELKRQGVDVISLAVGEPDAQPPLHVREAIKRAVDEGASRYTEVSGLRSLRDAICADSLARRGVAHAPHEVIVSAGAKHTLFNLAQALYDHGDEVVIPVPAWGSYAEQARLCGATPVLVPCQESDGFLVRPEAFAAALTPRTKAIILCTPSNPTGAAYSALDLRKLADVVRTSDAMVIVDEIYSELIYDGRARTSLLSVAPDLRDQIVIVDGVSKRFAMTGHRVGWALLPSTLAQACEAVQSQATTSVAAPMQLGAQAALLGPDSSVRQMREQLQQRRDFVVQAISSIPGLRVASPAGAFYAFVSVHGLLGARASGENTLGLQTDIDIAEHWLEHARVACVPGSAFHAPGYVRLSYATSMQQLEAAMTRIADAVAQLSR